MFIPSNKNRAVLMSLLVVVSIVIATHAQQPEEGIKLSKDTVYTNGFFNPTFTDTCMLQDLSTYGFIIDSILPISDSGLCFLGGGNILSFRVIGFNDEYTADFSHSCADPSFYRGEYFIYSMQFVKLCDFKFSAIGVPKRHEKQNSLIDTTYEQIVFYVEGYSDTLVIYGVPDYSTQIAKSVIPINGNEDMPGFAYGIYDLRGRKLSPLMTNKNNLIITNGIYITQTQNGVKLNIR